MRLDGGGVTYAMGVDEQGYIQPLYWGQALDEKAPLIARHPTELSGFDPAGSITAQEYAGQGEGLVSEPGIKAVFADGNRDLVLKYRGHKISGETLTVELADIRRPLTVTLHYVIDPATGVIARSASVRNGDSKPVRIDQIAAATYTLPVGNDYRLRYLTGPDGAPCVCISRRTNALSQRRRGWFGQAMPTCSNLGDRWSPVPARKASKMADSIDRSQAAASGEDGDVGWFATRSTRLLSSFILNLLALVSGPQPPLI
ncbi:glycoside hydrolase family 36 N-terminal domain-containing protein [Sphingobium yanoikuyae]|jgi:hypothetical protein|uniref:glycoside hydrolase family 36 N-terminal domain-containing protein n=1 Tax=Sphingobium yanoikuyae TaxID=13690 RepID=UPI002FDE571A